MFIQLLFREINSVNEIAAGALTLFPARFGKKVVASDVVDRVENKQEMLKM